MLAGTAHFSAACRPPSGKEEEMEETAKEETVTITVKEYNRLQEDANFLEALRTVGVDNWEGYEEAQEIV